MMEEIVRCGMCVVRVNIMELMIPHLLDNILDEFDYSTFGCDERGVVVEKCGVRGFHAVTYNGCCCIRDVHVVVGWAVRSCKGLMPTDPVHHCVLNEANEVLWPIHIVLQVEE